MRQWIIVRLTAAFTQHATTQRTFTIGGMTNGYYRRDGDITIMVWTQTSASPVLTRPVLDYFRISSIAYNY